MKAVLGMVFAVLALLAATGPAAASSGRDLTAGTGLVESPFGGTFAIHVNATSLDGADARGRFFLDFDIPGFGAFKEHGDVTCHKVAGNVATVGGAFDEPVFFGPAGPFQGVLIFIEDNGEPGSGRDRLSFAETAVPPLDCPIMEPRFPITQGNFVVHDRLAPVGPAEG
jgi:hypothetical protein